MCNTHELFNRYWSYPFLTLMNNFTIFRSSGWVPYKMKPNPQCIPLKSLQKPPKSPTWNCSLSFKSSEHILTKDYCFHSRKYVLQKWQKTMYWIPQVPLLNKTVIAQIFLQVSKLLHELQSSIKQNSFSMCTIHSKKLLPTTTLQYKNYCTRLATFLTLYKSI